MRVQTTIAWMAALLVVGVASIEADGRSIDDWFDLDSYPRVQRAVSAPVDSAVEPVKEKLVEEGRRKTVKQDVAVAVNKKTRTNQLTGGGSPVVIGGKPGGLPTAVGGGGSPAGVGGILPGGGVGGIGPGGAGWAFGWMKDFINTPVWSFGGSGTVKGGTAMPGIGTVSGAGIGVGNQGVGIAHGSAIGAGDVGQIGSTVAGGASSLFPNLFGGLPAIASLFGNPGGAGAGPGSGLGIGAGSAPVVGSISPPISKPGVGAGAGAAGGPGSGGGLFGSNWFGGNKGGSGVGSGAGGAGAGGAGSGGNDGIVSVTYGKPPADFYDSYDAGIYNPFSGWLFPPKEGAGGGPGGAPGGHALDSPTTSEVMVVRYPEFVRTIGKGLNRIRNTVSDIGQGFTQSFTKGFNDIGAGIGSGVYSIIPLEEVGNVNHNQGGFPNKGGAGLPGLLPGIGGGVPAPGGAAASGPVSTVYVNKEPSAPIATKPAGSWWSPGSWFGSGSGSGGGDLDGSTSTVYVEKPSAFGR